MIAKHLHKFLTGSVTPRQHHWSYVVLTIVLLQLISLALALTYEHVLTYMWLFFITELVGTATLVFFAMEMTKAKSRGATTRGRQLAFLYFCILVLSILFTFSIVTQS